MSDNTISYSEIETYQRCQYKHHLSYGKRLRSNRKEITSSTVGTIVHIALAAAFRKYHETNYEADIADIKIAMDNVVGDWLNEHLYKDTEFSLVYDEETGDFVADTSIYDEFVKEVYAAREIAYRTVLQLNVDQNWRVVELDGVPLIEYRAEYPMAFETSDNPLCFVGVIDLVAVNLNDGLTYVVDWKTRAKFQDDEFSNSIGGEDFNTQVSLYQKMLSLLGVEVHGTVIYQIYNKLPETPELNKPKKDGSQEMSRANIKTDWLTYQIALYQAGLDPADYLDMRDKLAHVEFWRPVTLFRGEHELQRRWNEARGWAIRIKMQGIWRLTPLKTENVMCLFCPFNKICLAEDRGYDVDALIETEYNIGTQQSKDN